MARKYTKKLYEMLDEGLLTHEQLVDVCLSWMSEQEVKDMMDENEFTELMREENAYPSKHEAMREMDKVVGRVHIAEWKEELSPDEWLMKE